MEALKEEKEETTEMKIDKEVRQRDALSAIMFYMVLEYVGQNINKGALKTRDKE